MSVMLQMADCLVGWEDCNRGMPDGISAKKTNKVFSLDKIDFEKQPRAQRVSDRTRADQRRAGRSNFGNLKDAAQTHAGRYTKLGFKSIQDRMEKDPFYLFNNAVGQITPDCCQFLEDLAKCISPDVGRTREKREKQLGTGVSTRLISCQTSTETSGSRWTSRRKQW